MTAKTDSAELAPYIKAGWQLIPLHPFDYFDEHKGKKRERGKSPLHSNWTTRPYKSKEQIAHMDDNQNVGCRLEAHQLVLDVDPRNFDEGDDPLKRLCKDCGLDLEKYPTVKTGSGGFHVYMTKPEDVPVRDSLEEYHGLEYKTKGRQVVAAGSIHPTTKNLYEWDFLSIPLKNAPEIPDKMLNLIRRPQSGTSAKGGGEHTQEELAVMLDVLDPEDFREHDDWLTLMQACHHATNGDGRSEFVEWSTRDPEYGDDGWIIGRRWDSLHSGQSDKARVTFRTLHKILKDAGQIETIPRPRAEDDFDAVDGDEELFAQDDEEVPEHEKLGPVERLNLTHWAVMNNGKFVIMYEQEDPATAIPEKGIPPRKKWVSAKKGDFIDEYGNKRVQQGEKTVTVGEAWLTWGGRRSAKGVTFDPEREHKGFLNLWTGWGVEPSTSGSWDRLNELVYEVLCDGDEKVYNYVLDWCAHMVQHPGKPAEVAICFQGGKGVGKGTLGRALAGIAGRHGMPVTSSEQLTGKFNDHLRDTILLFADEALKPYDKQGESRLKGLITEPIIAFEGKGKDVVTGRNMLHIIMASNEDWFVPAGMDGERRFMVSQANRKWVGKYGEFQKLHDQLEDGGLSRFLWDLLDRDLKGWHPRQSIPTTGALIDQKLRNLGATGQWWFNALMEGEPPCETTREDMDWGLEPIRIFYQDVQQSYEMHCKRNGIRSGTMGRSLEMLFAKGLADLCPDMRSRMKEPVSDDRPDVKIGSDGRARAYEFPSLLHCRADFERIIGGQIEWDK